MRLDARKSWVTSAGQADSYVWSSRPLAGDGPMTLWLVPSGAAGLDSHRGLRRSGLAGQRFDPVIGDGGRLPRSTPCSAPTAPASTSPWPLVLPWFLVLSAAFSLGLMEAVTAETGAHLTPPAWSTSISAGEQPIVRADYARMRLDDRRTRRVVATPWPPSRPAAADAMLRVLEVKAAAAEAALIVTDLAMKVCGGAAFRKELGIERRFRDARPPGSWRRRPTPCSTSSAGPSSACRC